MNVFSDFDRRGKLTFSKPFKAGGANPDPVKLQVLDRRLVGRAPTAHHTSAAPAVVASHRQLELHIATLRDVFFVNKSFVKDVFLSSKTFT